MRFRRLRGVLALGIAGVALVVYFAFFAARAETFSYSELRAAISARQVTEAYVTPTAVRALVRDAEGKTRSVAVARVDDPELVKELLLAGAKVNGELGGGGWQSTLSWALIVALVGFSMWLNRRFSGRSATVGENRAKVYAERDVSVSFADVAGVDEAKAELCEVVDFLRSPQKVRRLGGRMPKGILLVGPPGTGKTLLARAVAGEAKVPFFNISGSEFVELFVGVGAARVRDLFAQAKQKAPCIIFIDELDALGKVRGVGPMAHEEREQTLNQLLVEMDGFDPREGVILMAATNRPEILDPALLRAGRFDRHVLVDRPDKQGRLAILKVHAAKITMRADVDLDAIAGITVGMVGADLANIVNEAALLAVRANRDCVEQRDFEAAIERVVAGLEKRNRILSAKERERVAHHEVGHALAAIVLATGDRVQKVSIIPRGISALGYTLQRPLEDRFLMTQSELEAKVAVLLAGRACEDLVFGETSTGAQDDLVKATRIARSMVESYGMTTALGACSLPSDVAAPAPVSDNIASLIDAEMCRILDEQYARVKRLLALRLPAAKAAAQELLARETLSGAELELLLAAPMLDHVA